MIRVCCSCKKEFPLSSFPKADNKTGHRYRCAICCRQRANENKTNNVRIYLADVLKTSKQMVAKRKISDYELDIDFLVDLFEKQNGKCAISGLQMTHIAGKGCVPTNISIDRISNDLGYTKNNVHLTCRFINQAKMGMTMNEFKDVMYKTFTNMFQQGNSSQE